MKKKTKNKKQKMKKDQEKNNKNNRFNFKNKMSKRNVIIISIIGLVLIVLTFFLRNEIATFVVGPELSIPAQPAFYLTPSSGTAVSGESFDVDLMVNTEGLNIVAASSYIGFDPSKIQVQNIDAGGSVFDLEVENSFNNTEGLIKITRGQPGDGVSNDSDDGFTGDKGKIATISLRALPLAIGTAKLNFTRKLADAQSITNCKIKDAQNNDVFVCVSRLILDDGLGTDKLAAVNDGVYIIEPLPVIAPKDVWIKIKLELEGRKDKTITGAKIEIKHRLSGELVKTYADVNVSNDGSIEIDAPDLEEDTYNARLVVPGYLAHTLSNIILPDNLVVFTPARFIVGNLFDSDDIINELDAGVMNRKWGSSDKKADINQDSVVNEIDWGFINRNWGKKGD